MAMFEFLQGISPWYWLSFGIIVGVLEMATMSFFLIWPALAAIVMAGLLWLAPDLSPAIQITAFAALSIALTLVGRKMIMRFGDGGGEETMINNRAGQLIGRTGKVIDTGALEGAVEVDGIRWRATWEQTPNLAEGVAIKVDANRGMTLEVSPIQ